MLALVMQMKRINAIRMELIRSAAEIGDAAKANGTGLVVPQACVMRMKRINAIQMGLIRSAVEIGNAARVNGVKYE
jgi:hypothetical protein